MATIPLSTGARALLTHCQARLDVDLSARNAAARAVEQDDNALGRAQQAARRELQSRAVRGRTVDVAL
ncbi:hypothetical protein ODJ79_15390 [Actinoplanes sp. KI2]|uniref:hypothetical protein n=1 Tax=Actinoplanes sp. KI2 TaxID=2983315 RepID=UPI0021D57FC5|nr:hypothetical protein [Actinoplanes sp. KI2]MCU7725110.1 hypothetical protein [Actinoplanes sp. KI2]